MQHMEACELREKSKKIFIPEQKIYFNKIKNNEKIWNLPYLWCCCTSSESDTP